MTGGNGGRGLRWSGYASRTVTAVFTAFRSRGSRKRNDGTAGSLLPKTEEKRPRVGPINNSTESCWVFFVLAECHVSARTINDRCERSPAPTLTRGGGGSISKRERVRLRGRLPRAELLTGERFYRVPG